MRRKTHLGIGTVLLAVLLIFPYVSPLPGAVELRFNSMYSPKHPINRHAFTPWAGEVEKRTEGRVKVTLFPSNALATVREAFDATVSGVCDIAMNSDDWGGGTGKLSDGSHLHYPNEAFELEDGNLLVTDRNNDRCIHVDRAGNVIWCFGRELHHPHNANPLPDGNILISDSDGNRILEINRKKGIVWSYGDGSKETLWWPRSAIRLGNANTLITDSKNHRIVEVTPEGETVWKFQTEHVDKFYITHATGNGTFLVACTDGHHQAIEVDRARNIVWLFRNYRRPAPIFARLTNGFFKEIGPDGMPEHWVLATRLSEGGGKLIWDKNNKPRPCPGLEYDRPGALFLQQSIAVEPGAVYRVGAEIKAVDVKDTACLHMDFFDTLGGSLYHVVTEMPSGTLLAGTTDWTHDMFEAEAPPRATFVELRLYINDRGKVFVRNLMLHKA